MSSSLLSNVSVKQLKRVIVIRQRMEKLEGQLTDILGSSGANGQTGRRTMSAAARAKISAAQKLRWAKRGKGGRRGGMSAEGRRRLSLALKRRWKLAKASKRNAL
ncbi:MAG TPA: hypothetical protein VN281_22785 [Verrucomicrobiae bacterium]|jgi:hypothetical protein|nr:hypothetical protein [Verrucomicrobiae bacterium]